MNRKLKNRIESLEKRTACIDNGGHNYVFAKVSHTLNIVLVHYLCACGSEQVMRARSAKDAPVGWPNIDKLPVITATHRNALQELGVLTKEEK